MISFSPSTGRFVYTPDPNLVITCPLYVQHSTEITDQKGSTDYDISLFNTSLFIEDWEYWFTELMAFGF